MATVKVRSHYIIESEVDEAALKGDPDRWLTSREVARPMPLTLRVPGRLAGGMHKEIVPADVEIVRGQ